MTTFITEFNERNKNNHDTALIWQSKSISYAELAVLQTQLAQQLHYADVQPGQVIALKGDFSPVNIALLLALIANDCIIVLIPNELQHPEVFLAVTETEFLITSKITGKLNFQAYLPDKLHPLLQHLHLRNEAGLVLFSTGTSAEPKLILHALPPLLKKFRVPKHRFRTLAFLLFDHIGGFNTLMYTLANGGCLIIPENLNVTGVGRAIQKHQVQLLPTTPSFLNLMLAAQINREFDLSSLRLITYGTETMSEWTLEHCLKMFPGVRFQQTYGLSEVGILRSKSAADNSLLVKIGGEDYQTRVVDGILHIRAQTSMLGYLNAPCPFDDNGWLNTGDAVEEVGDFYRILGRGAQQINVGGQKVHPGMVEKAIINTPEVIDVLVRGEPHLLLGQTVVARVQVNKIVPQNQLKRTIIKYCRDSLQAYMLPSRIEQVTEPLMNSRHKKGWN